MWMSRLIREVLSLPAGSHDKKLGGTSGAAKGASFIFGGFVAKSLQNIEFCVAFVNWTMFCTFVVQCALLFSLVSLLLFAEAQ